MKKLLVLCSLVVLLTGVTAFNAAAIGITGDISFSGGTSPNAANWALATGFSAFTTVTVAAPVPTGAYAPIPTGTSATYTPFTWSPFANVTPLWTLTFSGITYSFNATSAIVDFQGTNNIVLHGAGIANISAGGYAPSPAYYTISTTAQGTTFAFADSTSSTPPAVPEPATLLLLGSGLVGLVAFRKKFKKA